jgi:hypothetical protein
MEPVRAASDTTASSGIDQRSGLVHSQRLGRFTLPPNGRVDQLGHVAGDDVVGLGVEYRSY